MSGLVLVEEAAEVRQTKSLDVDHFIYSEAKKVSKAEGTIEE